MQATWHALVRGKKRLDHSEDSPIPSTWSMSRREKTSSLGSNGCEYPRNQPSDQAESIGGTFLRAWRFWHPLERGFSIQKQPFCSLVITSHFGFLLSE